MSYLMMQAKSDTESNILTQDGLAQGMAQAKPSSSKSPSKNSYFSTIDITADPGEAQALRAADMCLA